MYEIFVHIMMGWEDMIQKKPVENLWVRTVSPSTQNAICKEAYVILCCVWAVSILKTTLTVVEPRVKNIYQQSVKFSVK